MNRPQWLASAFPGDISPFEHGLTLESGPDLKSEPESVEHADTMGRIAAGLGLEGIGWAKQVHGGTVLRVEEQGCAGEADALWCDRPGLGVIGRSADCPIVLVAGFRANGQPVWGMAHASWRSTVQGITTTLLRAMASDGMVSQTAQVVIGPSAGPCCYEVGDEVRRAMQSELGEHTGSFFKHCGERLMLDLWKANIDVLVKGGVPCDAVTATGQCTICGRGFASYRREGSSAGRFGLALGVQAHDGKG